MRFGAPLDLSRFEGHAASDPLTLRAATDELMFEIRNLSGQEYVDRYAKRHSVVGGADVAHVRASTNGDGYDRPRSAPHAPARRGDLGARRLSLPRVRGVAYQPTDPSTSSRMRSAWPLCRAYSSIMWV